MKEQLAWYIAGPVLGLCVVAFRGLLNARLGVTGGFSELIGRLGSAAWLRLARLVRPRVSPQPARCSLVVFGGPTSTATAG